MRRERRDPALLYDMLTYAREAEFFVRGRTWEDYRRDRMLRAAVEHVVMIVGEAAWKVSKTYQKEHPEIPWAAITVQRHVLVHEYDRIDDEKIWKVATVYIPPLIAQLALLVPTPPNDPLPEPDAERPGV